ncbi:MAG: GNAT family N-acetyltransferase [Anaerolineaceae bacterium]|nr:GNAT family N-acetyltransferase [Anaerolineaceae bacterium]
MTNLFQGQQVRLRAVEPSDWDLHFRWDMDTDGGRLTDEIWFPSSTEGARRWAEEQSRPKDGENFRFQIERVSDNVLVGTLNTHHCSPRCGTFMYGLAVMPEHQRQGYGAEAVRLVLRYYFHERRYQKVNAEVYAFNEPSILFHQYLGFVQEGRLRRMIYSGGEFHDVFIFGMTREEFEATGWNPEDKT